MPRDVKRGRFVRYDEDEIYTQIKEGLRDIHGNWIPDERDLRDESAATDWQSIEEERRRER